MAVTLTGTGGLFTRLGKIGLLFRNVNGVLGSTAPSPASAWGASGPTIADLGTAVNAIEAQYQASRQDLVDGLYSERDSARSVFSQLKNYLVNLGANTVYQMVLDDTLNVSSLENALSQLITQMVSSGHYVTAPTVSATVTPGASNNGNGVCAVTLTGPDGKSLIDSYAETIDTLCTIDSQISSGSLGIESFSYSGDNQQTNTTQWDWPKGSGASGSLTACDAASSTSSLLTNGGFETFTVANTPDSWTIAVGVAGTDIFSEASIVYAGAKALKFTGTGGAPLTEVYQDLTTLKPNTVYAGNVFMRDSGAGLVAGVVQIDLHNGSTVINDDAGTANSTTRAFGDLTTTYASHTFFFRTPRVLPSTIRLRIKVTTALTSGESVYIDHLAFAEATQLYSGGPYAKIFSGSTKFVVDDSFAIVVSNNYAGKFIQLFEQFFSMSTLGLRLPTSGVTLIPDSLLL